MREAEERAQLAKRAYQITMRYERFQNGWMVKFTRTGSDWVLRICTFADADKIRSIFRRFAIRQTSEDIAAFECAIQNGRGAVELRLGEEQYAALMQSPSST